MKKPPISISSCKKTELLVNTMKLRALLCMVLLAATTSSVLASSISDNDAIYVIRSVLSDNGFEGVTAQVADGRPNGGTKGLILGYRSTASSVEDLATETGGILGTFFGVVKTGWDCDDMSAVVGDRNGNAIGMWYCTKEWKDAYVRGRITEEEVLANVLGTMYSF